MTCNNCNTCEACLLAAECDTWRTKTVNANLEIQLLRAKCSELTTKLSSRNRWAHSWKLAAQKWYADGKLAQQVGKVAADDLALLRLQHEAYIAESGFTVLREEKSRGAEMLKTVRGKFNLAYQYLHRYGTHKDGCVRSDDGTCTCGLLQALRTL